MIPVAFAVLAVVGSLARVLVSARCNSPRLPLGTLIVNVAGSFAAGLLVGSGNTAMTLLGVAGLGSFTTFSTFSLELSLLGRVRAAGYAALTLALGLTAAGAGLALAS